MALTYILTGLYCANDRFDPGTEILLDKFKDVVSMLNGHSQSLNRIEQSARIWEENLPHRHKLKSAFAPTDMPTPLDDTQFYQIPKKTTAGVDYFMSLTFVQALLPEGYQYESLLSAVMEISTIERLSGLVCEGGLLWNTDSALILQILALGAMHASLPYLGYYCASIRRMGYGVQNLGIIATQFHYLQGFVSHLFCF